MVISFGKMPNQGQRSAKDKNLLRQIVLTASHVPLQEDDSHGTLKTVLPDEYDAATLYLLTDIEGLKTQKPYIKCEIESRVPGDSRHKAQYFLWLDLNAKGPRGEKVIKIAKASPK